MASAIDDIDASDMDQLLAETLLHHNSEIENDMQAIGLPMAPDSAISMPVTEAVGEVDTLNYPTITQQCGPIEQGFAYAFMTNTNDVFSNDTVSPSLPALTDDTLDESSDDDIDPDDDVIEVNEDGTEASRNPSVRKRKKHAPMTEEQQKMALLQLNAQRKLFNANPASRDFKNAPAYLQQPPASSSISPSPRERRSSNLSKNGSLASSPPQQGPKRNSPSLNKKKQPPTKKQKKADKKEIHADTLLTLSHLNECGKPFEKMVEGIVTYATGVLDKRQEDCTEPIEELLKLEREWKKGNAEIRGRVMGLLERYGLIPMGGVEAAAAGMVKLA